MKAQTLKLLKVYLAQNYFTVGNECYVQLPMGSPLSPLLTDVFMDRIETLILQLEMSKKHIAFWFWYVDGILVVVYFFSSFE